MRRLWLIASVAMAAVICFPAGASVNLQDLRGPQDTDWPCIQRLVPEIAATQMWRGPPIDSVATDERGAALDALADDLAARRVSIEEAERLIAEFAEKLDASERDEALTRLFDRTLSLINRDRSSIISGIRRYSQGQRRLAEQITEKNDRLQELGQEEVLARQELMAERNWDIRVFDDRKNSLAYLCEQPVLLEQRAFALARSMANHLE